MKFIAYILYIFGSLCEFAGVFVLLDCAIQHFFHREALIGWPWPVGLCLCLLGTANVMGFKFLQLRFFPPKK